MKTRALLLASLFLLSACTSVSKHPDEGRFPFAYEADTASVRRNGDNYGKEGIGHGYSETTVSADPADMLASLNAGESRLLFLYQDQCATCIAAHDSLTHFFLDSGVKVDSIDFTVPQDGFAALDRIKEAIPAASTAITNPIGTPSAFLFKAKDRVLQISFLSEKSSRENLAEIFANNMNFSNIFEFSSFDAYSRFIKEKDCLTYAASSPETFASRFYEDLVATAIKSPKYLAYFALDRASEEDRERLDLFCDASLFTVASGEVKEKASTAADASKLVERYYA